MLKLLKRIVINTIIFGIIYGSITYWMKHSIDIGRLSILLGVYLIVNFVIYTIFDKVDKK